LKHNVDNLTSHISEVDEIKTGVNYISAITEIEIISTLGKYSRQNSAGFERCSRVLSDGTKCKHSFAVSPRKPWKAKVVKQWRRLLKNITDGLSPVLKLTVLPLESNEVNEARAIIEHALKYGFGSLDAIIVATAKLNSLTVITSDKGMKACLRACDVSYWDAFDRNTQHN